MNKFVIVACIAGAVASVYSDNKDGAFIAFLLVFAAMLMAIIFDKP